MGEVSLKVIADQMFDDKSFGCLKGSVVCVSAFSALSRTRHRLRNKRRIRRFCRSCNSGLAVYFNQRAVASVFDGVTTEAAARLESALILPKRCQRINRRWCSWEWGKW